MLRICRIFCCAVWNLVPWLRIEPGSPALGAWCLNQQTSRGVPWIYCFCKVHFWVAQVWNFGVSFLPSLLPFNIPVATKLFRFYPEADRADFLLPFSLPPCFARALFASHLDFCQRKAQFSHSLSHQIRSDQPLSRVWLFATPWIAARQASLSITNSRSSLRLMSIKSVMPSSHLILCRPLILFPPIPPSIRVFSNESALHMRWPKYWSFSFSIIPSKEIQGLISFRMDWLDLLAVQGTLKSLLQIHSSKASILFFFFLINFILFLNFT